MKSNKKDKNNIIINVIGSLYITNDNSVNKVKNNKVSKSNTPT